MVLNGWVISIVAFLAQLLHNVQETATELMTVLTVRMWPWSVQEVGVVLTCGCGLLGGCFMYLAALISVRLQYKQLVCFSP